jgi:hypothetical protein
MLIGEIIVAGRGSDVPGLRFAVQLLRGLAEFLFAWPKEHKIRPNF